MFLRKLSELKMTQKLTGGGKIVIDSCKSCLREWHCKNIENIETIYWKMKCFIHGLIKHH